MKRSLKHDQNGLVSMIVVTILMFVITITAISFARTVRVEQRQALDHQLNTQAFYAAETGMNYAKKVIGDQIQAGRPVSALSKTDCPPQAAGPTNYYTDTLNLEVGVTVSCLLVTANPTSLVYDLDPSQPSKVFPLYPTAQINKVVVEWTPASGSTANCPNSATAADLKSAGSWNCAYGVIRTDLTNIGNGANLNRQTLAGNTFSNLFMPVMSGGTGSISFNGANSFGGGAMQGARGPAVCTTSLCRMEINLSGLTSDLFYMRIQTVYQPTKVTIKAMNNSTQVPLRDAQVVIDATGKAQDVLRRIQVRMPLISSDLHADYGIQSRDGICKQFKAYPESGYTNATLGC